MNKVLIVDDQQQNLYLMKTLLEGHGYQVVEATNGAEALELARIDPPDVIISDILMPVMDGFALCQEWMKDDGLRNVPFVFYTATYTDPKDEELAFSLGAARFIVKPVEIEEFVSILEQVIAEFESGLLAVPQKNPHEETAYYRMYNEALIRKLEDKILELEKVNHVLAEDVIERKRAEMEITRLFEESQRRLKQLEALHSIDIAISTSRDLRTTLSVLLEHVETLLDVDATDVLLFNPDLQQFRFSAGRGFHTDDIERANVRLGTSFAGRAALERQTVLMQACP
jgi:CheY-like chemotaxis protein